MRVLSAFPSSLFPLFFSHFPFPLPFSHSSFPLSFPSCSLFPPFLSFPFPFPILLFLPFSLLSVLLFLPLLSSHPSSAALPLPFSPSPPHSAFLPPFSSPPFPLLPPPLLSSPLPPPFFLLPLLPPVPLFPPPPLPPPPSSPSLLSPIPPLLLSLPLPLLALCSPPSGSGRGWLHSGAERSPSRVWKQPEAPSRRCGRSRAPPRGPGCPRASRLRSGRARGGAGCWARGGVGAGAAGLCAPPPSLPIWRGDTPDVGLSPPRPRARAARGPLRRQTGSRRRAGELPSVRLSVPAAPQGELAGAHGSSLPSAARALVVLDMMLWVLVGALLPVVLLAAPPPINKLALFPDKSAWCEAKNITQIVGHSGCKSKSIQNRACLGQCFSYSVPNTFPQSTESLVHCDSCMPSQSMWEIVTLDCPSHDEMPRVDKLVEKIVHCSCQACGKEASHEEMSFFTHGREEHPGSHPGRHSLEVEEPPGPTHPVEEGAEE